MVEQEMLKPNADISKIDVIFFIVKLLNIYRVKDTKFVESDSVFCQKQFCNKNKSKRLIIKILIMQKRFLSFF